MRLREIGNAMLSVVYPATCLACDAAVDPTSGDYFCGRCLSEFLTHEGRRCPRCAAALLPGIPAGSNCLSCRRGFHYIDASTCVGDFDGKLMDLIHTFKYSRRRSLGRALSGLLVERIASAPWRGDVGAVVPVPLNWRKFAGRGFNQAQIRARAVAKKLGAPCVSRVLKHASGGQPQVGLTRSQRIENAREQFRVGSTFALAGASVLLVDDVATTGATLSACARILRNDADVVRVYAAVLARTSLGESGRHADKVSESEGDNGC